MMVLFGSLGFLVCLVLWLNLSTWERSPARSWACLGILLWLVRRRAMGASEG